MPCNHCHYSRAHHREQSNPFSQHKSPSWTRFSLVQFQMKTKKTKNLIINCSNLVLEGVQFWHFITAGRPHTESSPQKTRLVLVTKCSQNLLAFVPTQCLCWNCSFPSIPLILMTDLQKEEIHLPKCIVLNNQSNILLQCYLLCFLFLNDVCLISVFTGLNSSAFYHAISNDSLKNLICCTHYSPSLKI